MKTVAPDYYKLFRCTASACRHTCCCGWEVDIDTDSLRRFEKLPDIAPYIDYEGTPHFRLLPGERCPFLNDDGLCAQIKKHGEQVLCQICADHPRFRSYWQDRVELGLGLVCEEAARLVLSRETPMKLVVLEDDGEPSQISEEELEIRRWRDNLIESVSFGGPEARLLEYLIYRHLPDALYDGRFEQRQRFVAAAFNEITGACEEAGGGFDNLVECARVFSYNVEYDDEVLEKRIAES